jgi:hypothetical protein
MSQIRCVNCSALFTITPQVPNQTYCSKDACQKKRRKEWQKKKRKIDQDYKDNQYRAQKAWADRNPEYWRMYRKKIVASQNTKSTPKSNYEEISKKTRPSNPNSKELKGKGILLNDGIFSLRVIDKPNSKMDVWIVEITRIIED